MKKKIGIYCQHNPATISKEGKAGITLVALVVTIVVLLILAGITITFIMGDNSVFKLAKEAKEKTGQAVEDEKAGMKSLIEQMESEINN